MSHESPLAAGRLQEIVEGGDLAEAEEAMGETDCPEGCHVESDGHCPHDYESAALTLGVI